MEINFGTLIHRVEWQQSEGVVLCGHRLQGYRQSKLINVILQLILCQLSSISNLTHSLQEAKTTSQDH